ncbi:hypothetical protein D3Z55_23300, partial [Clostridiaceae bacterium]|nr:hypothetical protein [Clostridiaceae bacterium]
FYTCKKWGFMNPCISASKNALYFSLLAPVLPFLKIDFVIMNLPVSLIGISLGILQYNDSLYTT